MNSNALATQYNNEHEPLKTITVTEYENNTNNIKQSSILNNFRENTNNNNLTINRINENAMVDSHGNIHVNKYYNITRNHNLSVASKMTDLSEMPMPIATQLHYNYSNMTNLSNNSQMSPRKEQIGKYK